MRISGAKRAAERKASLKDERIFALQRNGAEFRRCFVNCWFHANLEPSDDAPLEIERGVGTVHDSNRFKPITMGPHGVRTVKKRTVP